MPPFRTHGHWGRLNLRGRECAGLGVIKNKETWREAGGPGSSLPLFLSQDLTLRLVGSIGATPRSRNEPQRVERGLRDLETTESTPFILQTRKLGPMQPEPYGRSAGLGLASRPPLSPPPRTQHTDSLRKAPWPDGAGAWS